MRLDRGVYRRADALDPLHDELEAWLERLPARAVLTGLTAARVWELWLPPLPDDLPVFAAVPVGATHSRRAGVRVSRHPVVPRHRIVGGLPTASVPATLLACARVLSLLDLVVLVDSALHRRLCTRAELEEAAATGLPGAPLLRRALGWSDERAESAWEVLLRVLHRVCDVPVTPQVEIRDADGAFVARVDLLVDGTATAQEYDGADHLERRQYGRDRRRDSRLAGAGYVRHAWVKEEVLTRPVAILREADRAIGRAHDPRRVRAWQALLDASLFTTAGTTAFRARIRLPVPA